MIVRLLRDPLFTFIFLGALVFFLYLSFSNNSMTTIKLNNLTKDTLIDNFEKLTGRDASPADIANIEREYIEEEILFREAIANGMHLLDPEVRSQLIEEMRYRITGILPDPDEEQLIDFYLNNIDRYYSEPTITLEHIYFKHQPEEPELLLIQLNQGKTFLGDEFWRGNRMPDYGDSMLRGLFGQNFVNRLHSSH